MGPEWVLCLLTVFEYYGNEQRGRGMDSICRGFIV